MGGPGPDVVTLFTQDGCDHCAVVRACLRLSGVPFVERNASRDPGAAAALAATGIFATPLAVRGETVVFGSRRDELARRLGFACRCPDGGRDRR